MSTHAFPPCFQPFPFLEPAYAEELAGAVEVSYALVQSGPAVPADEVESHLEAVEVKVTWGTQTLSITHVEPGSTFAVGEGTSLELPGSLLGNARMSIVEAGYVNVPAGGSARIGTRMLEGPQSLAIPASGVVSVMLGNFTFNVATVRKGKVSPVGFLASLAGGATGFIGLSFLGHAAIAACMAMFLPKMGADDGEALDRTQLLEMRRLMNASAERELQLTALDPNQGAEAAGGGSEAAAHKGESGASGQDKPVTKPGHIAIRATDSKPSIQFTRQGEIEAARTSGMIAMLTSDPAAPSSPWGTASAGANEKSAMGDLWSADIGDAFGYGLGPSGTGLGGGGTADLVGGCVGPNCPSGLASLGKGPSGWGIDGAGDKDGIGRGHGRLPGTHNAKGPILRTPNTVVNGHIPAEVVQRIVRQNFGRFKFCYEEGLRRNPSLAGRVTTKFVIDRTGAVSQTSDGGSDLPDQAVTACIVRSFGNLSFPQPDGGITTVVYPISLAPGE